MTYDDLREMTFGPKAIEEATSTWAPYMRDVNEGSDFVVARQILYPEP
jgi:hypothetical protein